MWRLCSSYEFLTSKPLQMPGKSLVRNVRTLKLIMPLLRSGFQMCLVQLILISTIMSPLKHMLGLNNGASLPSGNFLMLTTLIYYLLFFFPPFLFISSVLLFFRVMSAFHFILIHTWPLKVMVPFLIAGCPMIILDWRDFWEVLRERVHWGSSQLTANFNQSNYSAYIKLQTMLMLL